MPISQLPPLSPPVAGSPARPWQINLPPAPSAAPAHSVPDVYLGAGAPLPAPVAIAPVSFQALAGPLHIGVVHLIGWLERLAAALAKASVPATGPQQPPAQAPGPVAPPAPGPGPVLANGSLSKAIAATPKGQPLSLGSGVFAFNNFGSDLAGVRGNRTDQNGLDLPASMPGLRGAGIDRTVIRMTPRTSTKAHDIPTTPFSTNQYSLMRVTGTVDLRDFTLQGTEQGHLYNGLRVHIADKPRLTNIKVTGVAGTSSSPPGETFGINDYRTRGAIYKNIEADGQGVGASGFGANNSSDVTIDGGYFHNNPKGIGATFWQTHNVNIIDTTTTNNKNGFNFERVTGNINIVRPTISNISGKHDISFGTDRPSAKVTIIDPVLPPGKKLRISIGSIFQGVPNQQKRSDIRVLVNGVDRTKELVEFR